MVELFCSDDMRAKYEREVHTKYERMTPLDVVKVDGGYVLPLEMSDTGVHESRQYGGVCDREFKFVEISLTKRVSPPNFACEFEDWFVGAKPGLSRNEIPYVDEKVIFLGALPKHYGHFILEGLARLWLLLDERYADLKCVYISDGGEDRFNDFFRLFGLKPEKLEKVSEPIRYRSVVVPEQSIRLQDYYHAAYKQTIDRILANVKPIENTRVYFSKKERKNDRAIGEAAIERVLSHNGFSIYYPELLTVEQTLAVLKGANEFVATSGTNIHNTIFLTDQAKSVCLNRSEHFHPIQIMIDRMKDLRMVYVDVYLFRAGKNWSVGPFLLFTGSHLRHYYERVCYSYRTRDVLLHIPHSLTNYLIRKLRRLLINHLYWRFRWVRKIWKLISRSV